MGVKNFGGANLGATNFRPFQKLKFPTIIIFPAFWAEGKNLPNRPKKKYGNIG